MVCVTLHRAPDQSTTGAVCPSGSLKSSEKLRGLLGAYTQQALYDPALTTASARAAFLATFDTAVDPLGELPQAERQRRAEAARSAYFTRLRLERTRKDAATRQTGGRR